MELPGGVAVGVAIQTGHPQAGLGALAVVGRVELLLGERRHQQAQAVELHGRQDVREQAVVVVDRDDLAPGNIAQLGAALEIHGRRELGQEGFGEIELDVVPLQARKHLDLHLGKDLTAQASALRRMR